MRPLLDCKWSTRQRFGKVPPGTFPWHEIGNSFNGSILNPPPGFIRLLMPNVGMFTASDPVPPDTEISIRYTVEVGGLPVYTELYDVRKLASELEVDREGAIEAW